MSKKRMFSKAIIESDAFLDMPLSAQGLYFHLGMQADDYGFVSPKRVMRMIGANDDDLKVLVAKRYVLTFDSGVVVIKHWHLNNTVRKDRSTETTYLLEMDELIKNEFGAYTEKSRASDKIQIMANTIQNDKQILPENNFNNGGVSVLTTTPLTNIQQSTDTKSTLQPNGNQMATEIRLDKIRLDKTSNTTNVVLAKPKTASQDINRMFEIWEEVVGYRIQSRVKANRFACSNLLKKHGMDKLSQLINGVAQAQSEKYAPNITDFCSLQQKLTDLIVWGRKKGMTNAAAQF